MAVTRGFVDSGEMKEFASALQINSFHVMDFLFTLNKTIQFLRFLNEFTDLNLLTSVS